MKKKCEKCNVYINTTRKTCPICFNTLEEVEESLYTPYPTIDSVLNISRSMYLKMFRFILLCIVTIVVLINILTYNNNLWSLVVISSSFCLYVTTLNIISRKYNIIVRLNNILISIFLIFLSIDFIDLNVYKSWEITYVLPFITITSIFTNMVIYYSNKKRYATSLFLILFNILQSLVPVVLYLINKDLYLSIWPIYMCLVFCLLCILSLIIFGTKEEVTEIKKRIHTK